MTCNMYITGTRVLIRPTYSSLTMSRLFSFFVLSYNLNGSNLKHIQMYIRNNKYRTLKNEVLQQELARASIFKIWQTLILY